jgi:hypothetical protein
MARKIIVGILLSSLLLTAGCSLIVKTAFGIDEIKEYRDTDVQSFLVESQRKVSCRQIVASIGQQDSLIRLDLDSTMMQHRGQPVQILYFDGDSLLFYHINCYTQSGLFQFNWNNYHSFDHFPPSPTVVVPHNKESMTLSNYTRILPSLKSSRRYTVLILWSNVARKVSAKAVDSVATNIQGRNDCSLWLVNTDQWWANYLNK